MHLSDRLPGVFETNPLPNAVNASLWTIPFELRFYVAVAALGVMGIVTRRRLLTATLIAIGAVFVLDPALFPVEPNIGATYYFALLFALGGLAFAWRDHIPLSIPVAACIVALLLWNPAQRTPASMSCALLGYVLLVVAYHPWLTVRGFRRLATIRTAFTSTRSRSSKR